MSKSYLYAILLISTGCLVIGCDDSLDPHSIPDLKIGTVRFLKEALEGQVIVTTDTLAEFQVTTDNLWNLKKVASAPVSFKNVQKIRLAAAKFLLNDNRVIIFGFKGESDLPYTTNNIHTFNAPQITIISNIKWSFEGFICALFFDFSNEKVYPALNMSFYADNKRVKSFKLSPDENRVTTKGMLKVDPQALTMIQHDQKVTIQISEDTTDTGYGVGSVFKNEEGKMRLFFSLIGKQSGFAIQGQKVRDFNELYFFVFKD